MGEDCSTGYCSCSDSSSGGSRPELVAMADSKPRRSSHNTSSPTKDALSSYPRNHEALRASNDTWPIHSCRALFPSPTPRPRELESSALHLPRLLAVSPSRPPLLSHSPRPCLELCLLLRSKRCSPASKLRAPLAEWLPGRVGGGMKGGKKQTESKTGL